MIIRIIPIPLSVQKRAKHNPPSLLVLHATEGASARSSIDHLRETGNSYHFIIARDSIDSDWTYKSEESEAIIFQCVNCDHRATHVKSKIPVPNTDSGSINDHSIGVCLANFQAPVRNAPSLEPERYTTSQIVTLKNLILSLKEQFPSLLHITTHVAVQPWNKTDPISIDGKSIALELGLNWWEPTSSDIEKYKPRG